MVFRTKSDVFINMAYILRGPPEGNPFTATTLQIRGYHSYQTTSCKQLKSLSRSWI